MSVVIPREARKIREELLNISWLLGIGGTAVSLALAIESFLRAASVLKATGYAGPRIISMMMPFPTTVLWLLFLAPALSLAGTVLTYVAWKKLQAGRDPTTYAVLGGVLLIASTVGTEGTVGAVSGILAILGVLIDQIRLRW